MPRFHRSVHDAYNEMTSLESPNDFFVAGFSAESPEEIDLVAKGRGGLEKVKEVLRASFESEVAVVMFRITAVDDRGKVKSYRTKLIHVVYIGPKTPVMKRAKVGPWNSALKQPFTMNLSIQTDDCDGDLSEAALERSLRASGGAHQPTYFDFANVSNGGDGIAENSFMSTPSLPPSPTSTMTPPRSPSGNRSYVACWNEQNRAFHARDADAVKRQYAEDHCKLIINDTSLGFAVYEGVDMVTEGFAKFFEDYHDAYEIVKVEKTQPDGDHTSEGIVFSHWISEEGQVTCGETLCIVGGKIVVHTIVIHRCQAPEVIASGNDDVESQATADEEQARETVGDDEDVSNRADAGGEDATVNTTPEPQESIASSNDDGFVDITGSGSEPGLLVEHPSTEEEETEIENVPEDPQQGEEDAPAEETLVEETFDHAQLNEDEIAQEVSPEPEQLEEDQQEPEPPHEEQQEFEE